jgi:hypothetical protein
MRHFRIRSLAPYSLHFRDELEQQIRGSGGFSKIVTMSAVTTAASSPGGLRPFFLVRGVFVGVEKSTQFQAVPLFCRRIEGVCWVRLMLSRAVGRAVYHSTKRARRSDDF